jgi:hypothetical protein
MLFTTTTLAVILPLEQRKSIEVVLHIVPLVSLLRRSGAKAYHVAYSKV